jgi:hypothetical protein
MRPLSSTKQYLKMVPVGSNIFELVVLDGLPSKVLSNSDDPPNSYYTRDTFTTHPTIPDAWKYLGRLDDRITLVNGEKVLPIPYEHHIRQNEFVQEAVVFGVGREVPGLILIASDHAKGMPKDEILMRVKPAIEEANAEAEAFGRINLEMIEVLEYGSEYPSTDKGTVIRAAFYKQFAEMINSIYARFEAPAVQDKQNDNLLKISGQELVQYLLDLFRSKIGITTLEPSTDLFEAGVDSLQAITARAYVMREVDLGGQSLGQNVVYEYPSVELLAQHISSLRSSGTSSKDDEIELMRQLIAKYSDFSPRGVGNIQPKEEALVSACRHYHARNKRPADKHNRS